MFKTPDITKAQIVAMVQAVIGVLISFSVPISDVQSSALLGLTTIIAALLIAGDAAIRRGRAKIVEANIAKEVELQRIKLALEVKQVESESSVSDAGS